MGTVSTQVGQEVGPCYGNSAVEVEAAVHGGAATATEFYITGDKGEYSAI